MIRIILIGLLFSVYSLQSISSQDLNNNEQNIEEEFEFSNITIATLEQYIRNGLPLEAKLEGEQILLDVKAGLQVCENMSKVPADLWQYKQCTAQQLRAGKVALTELKRKYLPRTSAASRIKLFW